MFEIRSDRTGQGSVKLTAERQKYFELISQGVSNNRACAIVGVRERTGRVWRAGKPKDPRAGLRSRAGRRPRELLMPRLPGPAGSRFLDLQERITIFTMLENKQGIRTIARALERSSSTISREVHRRSLTWDQGLNWRGTRTSAGPPGWPCTFAIQPVLGSEAPTRTPTACSANTSQRIEPFPP